MIPKKKAQVIKKAIIRGILNFCNKFRADEAITAKKRANKNGTTTLEAAFKPANMMTIQLTEINAIKFFNTTALI